MNKIELQIKAIAKAIATGKAKNKYAAANKIKALRKKQKAQQWNNFLSQ